MARRKFIVERDLPKVGTFERKQLQEAAQKSNGALRQLGADIPWLESYVADDKTSCIYLATDKAIIRKYAEISGFPATKINEVRKMMDPTTETVKTDQMRRRDFITLLGGAAAWPLVARAQQPARIPRLGVLLFSSTPTADPRWKPLVARCAISAMSKAATSRLHIVMRKAGRSASPISRPTSCAYSSLSV